MSFDRKMTRAATGSTSRGAFLSGAGKLALACAAVVSGAAGALLGTGGLALAYDSTCCQANHGNKPYCGQDSCPSGTFLGGQSLCCNEPITCGDKNVTCQLCYTNGTQTIQCVYATGSSSPCAC